MLQSLIPLAEHLAAIKWAIEADTASLKTFGADTDFESLPAEVQAIVKTANPVHLMALMLKHGRTDLILVNELVGMMIYEHWKREQEALRKEGSALIKKGVADLVAAGAVKPDADLKTKIEAHLAATKRALEILKRG